MTYIITPEFSIEFRHQKVGRDTSHHHVQLEQRSGGAPNLGWGNLRAVQWQGKATDAHAAASDETSKVKLVDTWAQQQVQQVGRFESKWGLKIGYCILSVPHHVFGLDIFQPHMFMTCCHRHTQMILFPGQLWQTGRESSLPELDPKSLSNWRISLNHRIVFTTLNHVESAKKWSQESSVQDPLSLNLLLENAIPVI